jgi:hypothetical protein
VEASGEEANLVANLVLLPKCGVTMFLPMLFLGTGSTTFLILTGSFKESTQVAGNRRHVFTMKFNTVGTVDIPKGQQHDQGDFPSLLLI